MTDFLLAGEEVFLYLTCLLSQQSVLLCLLQPRSPYHCFLWGYRRHLEEAAWTGDKTLEMLLEEVKEWPRQWRDHIQGSGFLGESLINRLTQYRMSLKVAFQLKCLFQEAGFRILGWESELCVHFLAVMSGRSHTHFQETVSCFLADFPPGKAAFLSVPDNWDAAGSVISWIYPVFKAKQQWEKWVCLKGAGFAALFLPTCCSVLSSFLSAPLHTPNRCGHVS